MQAKEAAEKLEITQRMLRHYEKEGLMEVGRSLNGYRTYTAADLRRAGRIRDFIATGFFNARNPRHERVPLGRGFWPVRRRRGEIARKA